MKETFIIAEIGINHNGDYEICREMLRVAKDVGADAAKLQLLTPTIISANESLIRAQENATLTLSEYRNLIKYANAIDLELFSSIGDIESYKIFEELGFSRAKISSSNLNNYQLHEKVAELKIPVVVSSGDATIAEILTLVDFYRSRSVDISLLHCISNYPAKGQDANISVIPFLKQLTTIPIGYSDHVEGSLASVTAVALGAQIIEKHFTLDKGLEGPDHGFSADPIELSNLIQNIRSVECMLGDADQYFMYMQNCRKAQSLVRRAIVFTSDKPKGYSIEEADIVIARPTHHTIDEIMTIDYKKILGMELKQNIKRFDPLSFHHFHEADKIQK